MMQLLYRLESVDRGSYVYPYFVLDQNGDQKCWHIVLLQFLQVSFFLPLPEFFQSHVD